MMQEKCEISGKNFGRESGTDVTSESLTQGTQREHSVGLLLPGFSVYHAFDSVAQVQDIEID